MSPLVGDILLYFYSFPSRSSRDSIAPEVRPKCAQRSFRFIPSSNKRHSSSSSSSVQGFPLFSGSVFFCLWDSFLYSETVKRKGETTKSFGKNLGKTEDILTLLSKNKATYGYWE